MGSGVQCPNAQCRYTIPPHVRECPVCNEQVGYPNVRACETPEEQAALDTRYKSAISCARAKKSRVVLKRFEQAVTHSKAVICRPLSVVQKLMSSDQDLYNNYYNMVDSNARIPEDNRWDAARESVDAKIFPYYHRSICFAALSLSDKGLQAYGDHCMVLRTEFIHRRATTFEENTFVFAQHRSLAVTEPVPPGYRATWADRGRLAVAKLEPLVDQGTSDSQFPGILMTSQANRSGDCIEVHIYNGIHRKAVEKVVGQRKPRRSDACIVASLKKKLQEAGPHYEVL